MLSRRRVQSVSVRTMERRSLRATRSHVEPWSYRCRRVENRPRRIQHRALVVSRLESARASLLRHRRRLARSSSARRSRPPASASSRPYQGDRAKSSATTSASFSTRLPLYGSLSRNLSSLPPLVAASPTRPISCASAHAATSTRVSRPRVLRDFVVGARRDVCCSCHALAAEPCLGVGAVHQRPPQDARAQRRVCQKSQRCQGRRPGHALHRARRGTLRRLRQPILGSPRRQQYRVQSN